MLDLRWELEKQKEEPFAAFQRRLLPHLPEASILGVRTPVIKALAKRVKNMQEAEVFLHALPHGTFEENNLHGFLIAEQGDFGCALRETERFLPYVDNWATCDQLRPRAFARDPEKLLEPIRRWMASGETYTVRFGVGMLLCHFLDKRFRPEYPEWVAEIRSDAYYVNMMRAWYFATALAKQYDAILPFLTEGRLDAWTHVRTVRKACESFRVPDAHKAVLKTWMPCTKEKRTNR